MSVYKGENVIAGGSVDTYFVRKPAWSQAISITLAQLKAGYAAPEDGVFIGYVNPLTPTSTYIPVTINGLEVGLCATWQTARSYLNLTCQVNQGDVIQCANINTADSISLSFIPFEDSTVTEPEVVTPEYIRNQNILSDYEAVTIGATAGAATTMQYDGFIIFAKGNTTLSKIFINNVEVSYACNIAGTAITVNIPVNKGDAVYITNQQTSDYTKAAFYKLRDYRGR